MNPKHYIRTHFCHLRNVIKFGVRLDVSVEGSHMSSNRCSANLLYQRRLLDHLFHTSVKMVFLVLSELESVNESHKAARNDFNSKHADHPHLR
jgi:hypothetical protein